MRSQGKRRLKRPSKRRNRRSEILRAAQRVMAAKGLSGATTREISREAGCSEGTLYVHFKGRVELLLAMLEESLPEMLEPFRVLDELAGQNTPQANLEMALAGVCRFQRRVAPLFAGLFGEPKLLKAFRKSLLAQGKGPHLSIGALAQYIEAEQRLGRLGQGIDARLSAQMMVAAAFFRAFVEHFFARPCQPGWAQFAKELVAMVAPGEVAEGRANAGKAGQRRATRERRTGS